jgi:tRNA threonylcarbamoyladenosine dehydratase
MEKSDQEGWMQRTIQCIGPENTGRLRNARVLVAGLGGVGAYAAEHLARAGIGSLTIVDSDRLQKTNMNRQILALQSTLGKPKTQVMKERLNDINPQLDLKTVNSFLKDKQLDDVLKEEYDYVVDAIDTLSPKIFLIYHALDKGHKLVSSMGAGGKLDPAKVKACDISRTYNCRLAKMLRKKLHPLGIRSGFTAIFSPEEVPPEAVFMTPGEKNKKSNVGTISYMPAVFGCHCASVVIRELIKLRH